MVACRSKLFALSDKQETETPSPSTEWKKICSRCILPEVCCFLPAQHNNTHTTNFTWTNNLQKNLLTVHTTRGLLFFYQHSIRTTYSTIHTLLISHEQITYKCDIKVFNTYFPTYIVITLRISQGHREIIFLHRHVCIQMCGSWLSGLLACSKQERQKVKHFHWKTSRASLSSNNRICSPSNVCPQHSRCMHVKNIYWTEFTQ